MSPKQVLKVNLTPDIFKDPLEVIQQITSHMDIKYTRVIQTYVMEDRKLKLSLEKQGSSYFKGSVVWIGNKKDDAQGTVFCVDTGSELKQVNPSSENTDNIELDLKKEILKISTVSKTNCSVCGKNIEIFDHVLSCPLCNSQAHGNHLAEWVKMKKSCPICKKSLELTPSGEIVAN